MAAPHPSKSGKRPNHALQSRTMLARTCPISGTPGQSRRRRNRTVMKHWTSTLSTMLTLLRPLSSKGMVGMIGGFVVTSMCKRTNLRQLGLRVFASSPCPRAAPFNSTGMWLANTTTERQCPKRLMALWTHLTSHKSIRPLN